MPAVIHCRASIILVGPAFDCRLRLALPMRRACASVYERPFLDSAPPPTESRSFSHFRGIGFTACVKDSVIRTPPSIQPLGDQASRWLPALCGELSRMKHSSGALFGQVGMSAKSLLLEICQHAPMMLMTIVMINPWLMLLCVYTFPRWLLRIVKISADKVDVTAPL